MYDALRGSRILTRRAPPGPLGAGRG